MNSVSDDLDKDWLPLNDEFSIAIGSIYNHKNLHTYKLQDGTSWEISEYCGPYHSLDH